MARKPTKDDIAYTTMVRCLFRAGGFRPHRRTWGKINRMCEEILDAPLDSTITPQHKIAAGHLQVLMQRSATQATVDLMNLSLKREAVDIKKQLADGVKQDKRASFDCLTEKEAYIFKLVHEKAVGGEPLNDKEAAFYGRMIQRINAEAQKGLDGQ